MKQDNQHQHQKHRLPDKRASLNQW